MKRQSLPIWRDANRLLVEVETVVRNFSRYHKYSVGQELRQQAMHICRVLSQALRSTARARINKVEQVLAAIDDMKVLLHLGKEISAFQNFMQFQRLHALEVTVDK